MKTLKYFSLISIVILAMSTASARHENYKSKPKCPPTPCLCGIPKPPETSAYNQSARVNVCGAKDAFVTGSFIYWEALEQGHYLVLLRNDSSTPTRQQAVNIDYEFDPGFKVGIGYNFKYDDWTTYVEYTRYHSRNSFSKTRPSWATTQVYFWLSSNDLANEYRSNLKIELDILDLELSRSEYRGQKLIFSPFWGLKGGFIDQSFTFTAVFTSSNLSNTVKSDSYLIGPRIGFYTKWLFGKGFSLNGKAAASLNYQKFHNMSASFQNMKIDNDYVVSPIVELLLGFNWGSYFDKNHWHFDIFAGYEVQVLWNQNMIVKERILSANANIDSEQLTLHGLNVGARFDF
ncbi:MAG: hypothetical protein KR126chlam4_00503 [Candidatus Anoxychlamydiales bacterium]|nr:hypothetical protein [Candidatus Anoxychlamydiales bacterium]NGX40675.1 hypothetical protein [Candidatus Anoxychlamydiales bacterium]HEU64834.1 hypothetical protein [Chlamydiota bacterium]